MARASALLTLHILFLLTFNAISIGGNHHDSFARLLHRRQSPTSVSARLSVLMPRGPGDASWTTVPGRGNSRRLSDDTFRMTQSMQDPKWSYGEAPDGKRSLIAYYPKGSYTFGYRPRGGFSFYAKGPVSLENAKEVTFGYSVFFPSGFAFNKGGKLPGLYGGDSDGVALSCSGGRRSDNCFSARLMWRSGGDGEFYTYLPPGAAANKKQCTFKNSDCNPTYGASIGRGSFKFATGRWTIVTETVRLNDVGKANGRLLLEANGNPVIDIDGPVLRTSDERGRFRGMQFQTFFGGSKPEFASPKDQRVYFSDVSLAIIQSF